MGAAAPSRECRWRGRFIEGGGDWVWKDVLSGYCGLEVGNSEDQRAKTVPREFPERGSAYCVPTSAFSQQPGLAESLQGVLLPENAKLILSTCRVPGHSWEQAG